MPEPSPEPYSRFRRRNLPHWEVAGATYFVTFRLAGSLPATVAAAWRDERERLKHETVNERADPSDTEWRRQARLLHTKFDSQLDMAGHGPIHLSYPPIAMLVVDALRHFENQRYELPAYVIMPNHVHLVLQPLPKEEVNRPWGLDEILRSIKSYTGRRANELLKSEGEFWQREYYDHLIRDQEEWGWYVEYTWNNPVAAGLCSAREVWPWSNAAALGG
jgi:REP element-mobilizing transposase RayT